MILRRCVAGGLLLGISMSLHAHRTDEYLQAAILTLQPRQLRVQLFLTPGTAVFRAVSAIMDTNHDGTISKTEQDSYVSRILKDISMSIDGRHLSPQLVSATFPTIEEFQEGRGELQLELAAELPRGPYERRLVLENHHQPDIAAYLVNTLTPTDPAIRLHAQRRNFQQSRYEVQYSDDSSSSDLLSSNVAWLSLTGVLLLVALVNRWKGSRQRS